MDSPAERLDEIRTRIAAACARAGRAPDSVTLVGAAKTVEVERLRPFIEAGLSAIGENYVQEGIAKIEVLGHGVEWHLIGALQSNKAQLAVANFDVIHSVDRPSLARALDKEAKMRNKVQEVLLQVNLVEESSKAGCTPKSLPSLLDASLGLTGLRVTGLMCLPPYHDDIEMARPFFALLREARDRLADSHGTELPNLSMGMSHDFEIAIEEGATMVRVGTRLFGERG